MNTKYIINKNDLINYLNEGKTNQQIADIVGCSKSQMGYLIHKFGLTECQKKKKLPTFKFEKIDSTEKAYSIGFIACDGAVSQNEQVEVSVAKSDKEILDYISKIINGRVFVDDTFDKKTRRFPRARCNKKIPDIKAFIGGCAKSERHLPIVSKSLMRYVLLGAFDADGCITWGYRKDKNRLWQKVSFTTSLGLSTGIQQLLLKEVGISTIVRPKSNENCFVLEFSNREDVLKFIHYIYCDDFVVLKRKYLKANALRLKLEENGEGAKQQ